jgi:hypothetical protein
MSQHIFYWSTLPVTVHMSLLSLSTSKFTVHVPAFSIGQLFPLTEHKPVSLIGQLSKWACLIYWSILLHHRTWSSLIYWSILPHHRTWASSIGQSFPITEQLSLIYWSILPHHRTWASSIGQSFPITEHEPHLLVNPSPITKLKPASSSGQTWLSKPMLAFRSLSLTPSPYLLVNSPVASSVWKPYPWDFLWALIGTISLRCSRYKLLIIQTFHSDRCLPSCFMVTHIKMIHSPDQLASLMRSDALLWCELSGFLTLPY